MILSPMSPPDKTRLRLLPLEGPLTPADIAAVGLLPPAAQRLAAWINGRSDQLGLSSFALETHLTTPIER